jgi:ribosomal protein S18 acetylase RimI-like enzyme/catechol 2,3-dioxygenase-like lactoylglutathione lyase family enzyme
MRVAALTLADAPAYRELMLEAYARDADAYTSTAEERAREPLSWWADRIAPASGLGQSFGAFDAGRLVGAVALEYSARAKTAHAGLVLGMVVQPHARRQGVGRALMQAALEAARTRPGLEVLRLTVTEGNDAALRLYESVGFARWGVEPSAIRTPTGDRAKVHMALRLDDAVSSRRGSTTMKLGYTILYVPDVAASLAFFERAFGLPRRFLHESGTYGELDTGATTLAFAAHGLGDLNFPGGHVQADRSPQPLGMEIGLVTDDVPAAHARALQAGAAELSAPVAKPWGQVVSYVRCPDGCLVELCTPVGA